jgi:hypothetical protein
MTQMMQQYQQAAAAAANQTIGGNWTTEQQQVLSDILGFRDPPFPELKNHAFAVYFSIKNHMIFGLFKTSKMSLTTLSCYTWKSVRK